METIISSSHAIVAAILLLSYFFIITMKKKIVKKNYNVTNKNNNSSNVRMVPKVSGGLPILGHAIAFSSNTESFLRSCKEKYGNAFQLNIMGKKMVIIDGTYKYDFFALPEKVVSFTEMNIQTMAPELTFGMETLTNPYHIPIIRRQFVGQNLEQYLHRVDNRVKNIIKNNIGNKVVTTRAPGNNDNYTEKKVAIINNCEFLAWKVVASCSASSFLGDEISQDEKIINVFFEYHKACYQIMQYTSILPKCLLRFVAKSVKEQETIIRDAVVPEVNRRRQMMNNADNDNTSLPKDFLSHLAKLKHKSPEDIAKRMMAFIFASMVTSASALTHAIYDLAGRKKEWTVLLSEQKRVIKKHGNDLTKHAMDDMPYLHAFIWESMRVAAMPIQQARLATGKDGVVLTSQTQKQTHTKNNENENNEKAEYEDSILIPKGASIMMSGYLSSIDKSVKRSDEFWPGRFLEKEEVQNTTDTAVGAVVGYGEKEEEKKDCDNDIEDKYSFNTVKLISDPASQGFFPFGIGRHYCPGRQFALAEIKGALCVLLRSYRFQTVSGGIAKYERIPSDTRRINEPVEFVMSSM